MVFPSTTFPLTIFLLLAFIRIGLSDFILSPLSNDIAKGDCILTALGVAKFTSTTPYFKIGENGAVFDVLDVRDRLGDQFHGDYFPDVLNATVLFASLTIRDYTRAVIDKKLFCCATLQDGNDTVIQFPLKLEEENQEESPPPPSSQQNITVIVLILVIVIICIICVILVCVVVYLGCKLFELKKESKPVSDEQNLESSSHTPQQDIESSSHTPQQDIESSSHTPQQDSPLGVNQTEDNQESEQTKC